jgi:hypothetical protein
MPNHMTNIIVIAAPISEVTDVLVSGHHCAAHPHGGMVFNLHRLFPEDIPATDPTGCTS